MAIIEKDGQQINVEDGHAIKDACEKFDIPFGCTQGYCGTCKISIVEGEANLSELSNEEKMMERDRNHRLACQAKIVKGIVKLKISE
jgi:phenol/toluene 2-monooxygenase (NADH) P5/A5